ncbi:MAG: twin-arginine translocase subunit TatC [Pseudomonadota bacterium]
MAFGERYIQYLEQIRFILIRILCFFTLSIGGIYYYSDAILRFFLFRLNLENLININIYLTDSFMTYVYFSIYLAIFIIYIYIILEIYLFVYDAFTREELRVFQIIYFISLLLYFISILLVYFYILPLVVKIFLLNEKYCRFLSLIHAFFMLFFMFYIVLQLPVLLIGLIKLKLIAVDRLRAFRKYFIVLSFIIAAVVTPPDVMSQIILALLLIVLYELIIILFDVFCL